MMSNRLAQSGVLERAESSSASQSSTGIPIPSPSGKGICQEGLQLHGQAGGEGKATSESMSPRKEAACAKLPAPAAAEAVGVTLGEQLVQQGVGAGSSGLAYPSQLCCHPHSGFSLRCALAWPLPAGVRSSSEVLGLRWVPSPAVGSGAQQQAWPQHLAALWLLGLIPCLEENCSIPGAGSCSCGLEH